MGFQSVIVPVFGRADDALALDMAFAVARPFEGYVEAVFIHPDPRLAVPYMGTPVTPEVVQEIINSATQLAQQSAEAAHKAVAAAAARAGATLIESAKTASGLTCVFHVAYGALGATLLARARLADVIVMGPMPGLPDLHDAFLEVLMKSGQPVLVAAAKPVAALTAHAAVGWDGGAAAAHALRAAVPLLAKCGKVTLYTVAEGGHAHLNAPRAYLAHHGIGAETREVPSDGAGAGIALLKAAMADGASVLVAGGYGHSRLGETLFGGTTIDLTSQAALPLFLVH